MTDFLENIHFEVEEEITQPTEKCTSLPEFEEELRGILVEPALVNILYDLMGCIECATVAKSLLTHLQRDGTMRLHGSTDCGSDREIVITLSKDKPTVVIQDFDDYLHSFVCSKIGGEQYNQTVYAVACMLVHGELGNRTVLQTHFDSGLREEHHFRQPYWWYNPNDSYLIGNKILALLFP